MECFVSWIIYQDYTTVAVSRYWHTIMANHLVRWGKATSALVCTWVVDRSGMSIFADIPSDETLNRGPLALLLRRQYEFSFLINIVQFFNFFKFSIFCSIIDYIIGC